MAFDPVSATAQYIDALGPQALQKAHDYTVGKEWLLLWGLIVAAAVTWLILRSGLLDRVAQRINPKRLNLRAFLVGLTYFLLSALLTLPWSLYADYFREKSYGRTSQPIADFLGQAALSTAISAFVGALFIIGVYALMRRAGRRWWIWSGAMAAAVLAFVILLSPVLVEPLFNKYEPVPPGAVRDAVVGMAKTAGIPQDKVFMFDGSRQSNNFTANAGGIGSTARVAISDVAFKNASLDEVRAVTGHEIGHYVLKHTWMGVAFFAALATLIFFIADRTFPRVARLFGSNAALSDPRGLPVLLFLATLLGLIALPITSAFARTIEWQADDYSLRTENRPDALATALVKTAEYRYPRPGRIQELLFYDHPSVERRVRNAMDWKARHPEPPTP
ncbi:MAG: M48 family metallopeptidase [Sphingomicrobium sp.]